MAYTTPPTFNTGAPPPLSAANLNTYLRDNFADHQGRIVALESSSGATVNTYWRNAVRAATTGNITLSGTQTVDTIALVVGDRVLVKDQTTASQNGIYDVAAGAWARSADADTSAKVPPSMVTSVQAGAVNHDTIWMLTNDSVTLNSTALTFAQIQVTVNAAAGSVSFTPTGGIAATNVQAALVELDGDKANTTHVHAGTDITTATINIARIGTGTKNTDTFYRGDNTFALPVLAGTIIPENYGAVGDGTTDDTTAVQAAATAAIPNGKRLLFSPGKTYRITSSLVLDTGTHGFSAVDFSASGYGATILQATNNTPVVTVQGENPHNFVIEGLRLKFLSAQASTNTASYGIRFDSTHNGTTTAGTYNFTLRDLKFDGVFRGIGQLQSSTRAAWGVWVSGCEMESNTSGALVWLYSVGGGGQPNVHVSNCHINRTSATEESFYFVGCNTLGLTNIEVNAGTGRILRTTTCTTVRLTSFNTEACQVPTGTGTWDSAYLFFEDTDVALDSCEFRSCTFGASSGPQYGVFAGFGTNKAASLRRVSMWTDITPTPVPYIFGAPTNPSFYPSQIELSGLSPGTNINDYNTLESWVPARLRYDSARMKSPRVAQLTSDVPTAVTTFADITGLTFPVISGATYAFRARIIYTVNAVTTGAAFSINGPASPTQLAYSVTRPSTTATYGAAGLAPTTLSVKAYDQPTFTTATPETTGNIAIVEGIIQPSANGTLAVRFASEVAIANGVVAKVGSTLEVL